MSDNECPICKTKGVDFKYYGQECYYSCPMCGNFFLEDFLGYDDRQYDTKKLQSYLFYHKGDKRPFIAFGDVYSKLDKTGWIDIYNLTPEMVENWYPKTFAEKIDLILFWIADKSTFMGEEIAISIGELSELFFMKNEIPSGDDSEEKYIQELNYIGGFLQQEGFIKVIHAIKGWSLGDSVLHNKGLWLILLDKGYNRIYDLQKRQQNNKNVFVAMSFNPEIENIYNAITSAIINAKCEIVSMKHRIHNKQIVPEMLRLIKESKILVMDISEPNFGAYYEAGYAQGLGKEVILTCKSDIMKKDKFLCSDNNDKECDFLKKYSKPHFDIAQKQILVWEDETDLTKQLTEWIKFLMG